MRKLLASAVGITVAAMMATSAWALDVQKMLGKWKWQDFIVEVTKGGEHGLSAKVVSGPKNVGMEMIQSKLEEKDGVVVGRIRHPGNGKVYNTKMSMPDDMSWKLDGCTDDGACATGIFTKVE